MNITDDYKQYRQYFAKLRILDGINNLYGKILIEAITSDGRILVGIRSKEAIDQTLREWSGLSP